MRRHYFWLVVQWGNMRVSCVRMEQRIAWLRAASYLLGFKLHWWSLFETSFSDRRIIARVTTIAGFHKGGEPGVSKGP